MKWGGYLTIAGLRQAFTSGRQTRRRFLKAGCEVSVKVFHGSERRIGKTAIGLLLGFLCDEAVSIDQLLPILREEPYTRSDFICPDVLLYLEQKYGSKKIYPLGMTVMELRNKLNVDDQGLSLNDTTKVKTQLDEQHADLNRYLMASSEGPQGSKKISAFKASFDPILARMKRKQNVVMTHRQALERVAELLAQFLLRLTDREQRVARPIASSVNNQFYESKSCITDSYKYILQSFIHTKEGFAFDISKIVQIHDLLTYIIVHHREFANDPILLELNPLVQAYFEAYVSTNYGFSQLAKLQIGMQIGHNLLQTIQDDIDTIYNYFREYEFKQFSRSTTVQQKPRTHSLTPLHKATSAYALGEVLNASGFEGAEKGAEKSADQDQKECSKMIEFAQLCSEQPMSQKFDQSFILNADQFNSNEMKVIFYVTDEAHIYAVSNLLAANNSEEFFNLLPQYNSQSDSVNFLAQLHFIFSDMTIKDYYEKLAAYSQNGIPVPNFFQSSQKLTTQQLQSPLLAENGSAYDKEGSANSATAQNVPAISQPHRLVEIYYSQGVTQEIFQPVPHNALPIDAPELVIPLFPFVSLAKFNKKLTYLIHKQSKMRYRLKTVIGVYRHGDRYPKQKSKIAVTTPEVCDFFFDLYNLTQNKPEDISINEDNQEGLNTIVEKFS